MDAHVPTMTCEKFKATFGRRTDETTRAERAPLVAHAIECQSCRAEMMTYIVKTYGLSVLIATMLTGVDPIGETDLQDPEFREAIEDGRRKYREQKQGGSK